VKLINPKKEPIIQTPDSTIDSNITNQNQQLTDDPTNQDIFSNQEFENTESNTDQNVIDSNIDSNNDSNDDSETDSYIDSLPKVTVEIPRRSSRPNKGVKPQKYEGLTLLATRAFSNIENETDDLSSVDFKEPQN
jgi:hypothetical protein